MIPEAVDLYGLDPSEFVAARNLLAKQLKAAKRADEAAVVAKLPRPRMGEYTLNRVARAQPDAVAAFAQAVQAATSAQSSAIGGGSGEALRSTTADLRTATAKLMDAATRQLRRDERDGPTQRDEVLSVVRSLTNEAGVAQLVAGLVGSAAQPAASDLFAGAPDPPAVSPTREKVTKPALTRTEARDEPAPRGPTKAVLAAERRRQADIERAAKDLAAAERELKLAQRAVDTAQRALDAASIRLEQSETARAQAADALTTLTAPIA